MNIFVVSFPKNVLWVQKSTPNCFVNGELGVYSVRIERQIRMFKFGLRSLVAKKIVLLIKRIMTNTHTYLSCGKG